MKDVVTMKRLIRASKSAPLYHGTTWMNAIEIIESNELRANVSNETETNGVSFTRNSREAYDQVVFVIDQELLSHNYKISPVYREGIAGLDLAEERVPRTIKNIRKYIIELRWNNPIWFKTLRRQLTREFDNPDLLSQPSKGSDFNLAYEVNKLIETAHKYNIKIDKTFQEAEYWIDQWKQHIPDIETENWIEQRKFRKSKTFS